MVTHQAIRIVALLALTMSLSKTAAASQSPPPPPKAPQVRTESPTVGVIVQVFRDYRRFNLTERHLHLPSSYVKWLETAGARVLPIMLNQDDAYYRRVFAMTNGLLLPGGDNLLDPKRNTPLMAAAKKLYALAVEANRGGNHYPIWGTCLGLELLTVLSSGQNTLESCEGWDESLPVRMVPNAATETRLFAPAAYMNTSTSSLGYPQTIMDVMASENVTYNHHYKCVTLESLKRAKLEHFYKPVGFSADRRGREFVTIFEAREYPFYGVQFHPEKAPFEHQVIEGQLNMPHSPEAIAVSRYFADYFVQSCRLNDHQQADPPKSECHANSYACNGSEPRLIYAYRPTYLAPDGDMYEQRYLFPFAGNGARANENGLAELDLVEFMDFVPAKGQKPDETVG